MDYTMIGQFNNFFGPPYLENIWRIAEFVGAVWLFFVVLAQRVYIPSFKQCHEGNIFFKKMGQFGIYLQAFLSLFLMSDAFEFNQTPHVFTIIFLWSSIVSKGKMYLTLWKVINPYTEEEFDTEIES